MPTTMMDKDGGQLFCEVLRPRARGAVTRAAMTGSYPKPCSAVSPPDRDRQADIRVCKGGPQSGRVILSHNHIVLS